MSAPEQPRRVWASPQDVSDWLQLGDNGIRKLREMRRDGTGPRFVPIGRQVRYAWADVHTWCRDRASRTEAAR